MINFSIILSLIITIGINFYVGFLYNKMYNEKIVNTTRRVSLKILKEAARVNKKENDVFLIKKTKRWYVCYLTFFYSSILLILLKFYCILCK